MNHNATVSPVQVHQGHSHFHDYIESFHLPEGQKGLEESGKSVQDTLRNQFLNDNDWDQKLCLRNCFKLTQKQYVDFCLDKKCGGADFMRAADILGYVKH